MSNALASSWFAKYFAKAFLQNYSAVVGLPIGAKAETDLNWVGFLAAIMRAPPPPMEKPVIDLDWGLTGKKVSTV